MEMDFQTLNMQSGNDPRGEAMDKNQETAAHTKRLIGAAATHARANIFCRRQ